jgi:hypothetical protein
MAKNSFLLNFVVHDHQTSHVTFVVIKLIKRRITSLSPFSFPNLHQRSDFSCFHQRFQSSLPLQTANMSEITHPTIKGKFVNIFFLYKRPQT